MSASKYPGPLGRAPQVESAHSWEPDYEAVEAAKETAERQRDEARRALHGLRTAVKAVMLTDRMSDWDAVGNALIESDRIPHPDVP